MEFVLDVGEEILGLGIVHGLVPLEYHDVPRLAVLYESPAIGGEGFHGEGLTGFDGRLVARIVRGDGITGMEIPLLDLMAAEPKLCKYLDIPLQHIADPVLTAMRRSTTGRETRALLEKIRAKVPGVVLRTTLMVGHPGETEAAFNELLDFVQEARFERLGAFQYSEEEGTWGAAHLKDEMLPELKQERYDRLMEVQSDISAAFNRSRIGTTAKVLFDSASDGVLMGRSQWESPEVDGEILVSEASFRNRGLQSSQIIGTFAECKITAAGEYDLLGEPL